MSNDERPQVGDEYPNASCPKLDAGSYRDFSFVLVAFVVALLVAACNSLM